MGTWGSGTHPLLAHVLRGQKGLTHCFHKAQRRWDGTGLTRCLHRVWRGTGLDAHTDCVCHHEDETGLTHCLRAWFLRLKYRISFFRIAWFLGGTEGGQGWTVLSKSTS